MNTGSFINYIKTDDIYKGTAEDVEITFDTSNYELDRSLPKAKKQKDYWFMKDELGGNIMKELVGLKEKIIVT